MYIYYIYIYMYIYMSITYTIEKKTECSYNSWCHGNMLFFEILAPP